MADRLDGITLLVDLLNLPLHLWLRGSLLLVEEPHHLRIEAYMCVVEGKLLLLNRLGLDRWSRLDRGIRLRGFGNTERATEDAVDTREEPVWPLDCMSHSPKDEHLLVGVWHAEA